MGDKEVEAVTTVHDYDIGHQERANDEASNKNRSSHTSSKNVFDVCLTLSI